MGGSRKRSRERSAHHRDDYYVRDDDARYLGTDDRRPTPEWGDGEWTRAERDTYRHRDSNRRSSRERDAVRNSPGHKADGDDAYHRSPERAALHAALAAPPPDVLHSGAATQRSLHAEARTEDAWDRDDAERDYERRDRRRARYSRRDEPERYHRRSDGDGDRERGYTSRGRSYASSGDHPHASESAHDYDSGSGSDDGAGRGKRRGESSGYDSSGRRRRDCESGSGDDGGRRRSDGAVASDTIVVKGLSERIRDRDIIDALSDVPGFRDVRSYYSRRGEPSGVTAYLEFDSVESATAAKKGPLDSLAAEWGRRVEVDWAEPTQTSADWTCRTCHELNYHRRAHCHRCKCPKGELREAATTTIRINGISPQTTETDLSYLIKPIAATTSIRLVRDKFTQVPKGMAFASFATPADADAVRLALDGTAPDFALGQLSVSFARDRFPRAAAGASASDAVAAAQAMNSTYAGRKPAGVDAADAAAPPGAEWQPIDFESEALGVAGQSGGGGDGDAADAQASGFVYDEATGYYYDAVSQYFYDANTGLYYHPSTNEWYCQNAETGEYEAVPQSTDDAAPGTANDGAGDAAFASGEPAALGPGAQAAALNGNSVPTVGAAVKKKVNRKAAVLGGGPELNPQGLKALTAAAVKPASAMLTSTAKPAAVTTVDSNAVAEWLERKNAVQAKKPSAPAAAAKAPPEPQSAPAPVTMQSMPPPAPKQSCATTVAGGVRIREKVYGVAAQPSAQTAGRVQGVLYQGKYS